MTRTVNQAVGSISTESRWIMQLVANHYQTRWEEYVNQGRPKSGPRASTDIRPAISRLARGPHFVCGCCHLAARRSSQPMPRFQRTYVTLTTPLNPFISFWFIPFFKNYFLLLFRWKKTPKIVTMFGLEQFKPLNPEM